MANSVIKLRPKAEVVSNRPTVVPGEVETSQITYFGEKTTVGVKTKGFRGTRGDRWKTIDWNDGIILEIVNAARSASVGKGGANQLLSALAQRMLMNCQGIKVCAYFRIEGLLPLSSLANHPFY